MADAPDDQGYILATPDSSGLLTQARTLAADPTKGIGLSDSGAGQPLNIVPTAMLESIQAVTDNGFIAKTNTNTATSRELEGDSTINVENGDGVDGNPIFGVNDNTTVQQVVVQYNGSEVGTRAQINLMGSGSLNITALDNPSEDRVDITLSANSSPIDAPVWVSQENGVLTNEVNIGALTSGLLKIGVSAGYATPATAVAGTDYYAPMLPTNASCSLIEGGTKIFLGTSSGQVTALGGSAQLVSSGQGTLALATAANGVTAIGYAAADSRAVYNQCTFLGANTDASASGLTNSTALGSLAVFSQSDMALIGNATRTCINYSDPNTKAIQPYALQLGSDSGSIAPQVLMLSSSQPTLGNIPSGAGVWYVDTNTPKFATSGGVATLMPNPMSAVGDLVVGGTGGSATRLGIGATGTLLTSTGPGTPPVWGPGGLTNPMTNAGDLIVGGASGVPSRLGIGTENQALISTGTTTSWKTIAGQALSFQCGNGSYDGPVGGNQTYSWDLNPALVPFLLNPATFAQFMVNIPLSASQTGGGASLGVRFTINNGVADYDAYNLNFATGTGPISGVSIGGNVSAIADSGINSGMRIHLLFTSFTGTFAELITPDTIAFMYFPEGAF